MLNTPDFTAWLSSKYAATTVYQVLSNARTALRAAGAPGLSLDVPPAFPELLRESLVQASTREPSPSLSQVRNWHQGWARWADYLLEVHGFPLMPLRPRRGTPVLPSTDPGLRPLPVPPLVANALALLVLPPPTATVRSLRTDILAAAHWGDLDWGGLLPEVASSVRIYWRALNGDAQHLDSAYTFPWLVLAAWATGTVGALPPPEWPLVAVDGQNALSAATITLAIQHVRARRIPFVPIRPVGQTLVMEGRTPVLVQLNAGPAGAPAVQSTFSPLPWAPPTPGNAPGMPQEPPGGSAPRETSAQGVVASPRPLQPAWAAGLPPLPEPPRLEEPQAVAPPRDALGTGPTTTATRALFTQLGAQLVASAQELNTRVEESRRGDVAEQLRRLASELPAKDGEK